jgi:hypothetical protein
MTTFSRRFGALLAAKLLALGLAATLAGPSAAATLSLNGPSTITAAAKRADPSLGLSLDKAAGVTFTFLSGDTGAINKLAETGSGWNKLFWSTKAVAGATSEVILMGPGLLPFKFNTRDSGGIGFSNVNPYTTRGSAVLYEIISGKSAIVRYDNGGGTFDDLVARIDVVTTPLPAAAWLLLGGLGGLGLLAAGRRRRA